MLKYDVVQPQIVSNTLQPERGQFGKPGPSTPGPAVRFEGDHDTSQAMDTGEGSGSLSVTNKRKRPSNSYGLYEDEDPPKTSPRRPRSMYSRSSSSWRGPKVTYTLSRRTVEEESIPERPGKKRRTVVEVYESPEVVIFNDMPRRIEAPPDLDNDEAMEDEQPLQVPTTPAKGRQAPGSARKPMSAAKKAFLDGLDEDVS